MPSVAEVPQTVDLHRWHGRMLPWLMAAVPADAALYRGEGTASSDSVGAGRRWRAA